MKIEITKLNKYGLPELANCPEHGTIKIKSMPVEATGRGKSIAMQNAMHGHADHGMGARNGILECGCVFEEYNNPLEYKFGKVISLTELANDISFNINHNIDVSDDEVEFKNKMFEIFSQNIVRGDINLQFEDGFTGEEYDVIINAFPGIEDYFDDMKNIIEEYYAKPEMQSYPSTYTWDDFYTIKNDGSQATADYLIRWCRHNNVDVCLDGVDDPSEIANVCVAAMYGDIEL